MSPSAGSGDMDALRVNLDRAPQLEYEENMDNINRLEDVAVGQIYRSLKRHSSWRQVIVY